ncbi:MAG TPA: ABC transporter permease [Thermoclostridium sp.]|nr:ABC transporter permease [Thermoclostridium sp.]
MLGKLMKYEIKATARWFLPFYVAMLFSAILNKFIFINPILNNTFVQEESFIAILQGILSSLSMFLYVALFFGLYVATLIVVIQRFYKSLLGDEGYLMFTLPVKTWQNILCKLLTSMLWAFASSLVAFGSIFILIPGEELKQIPQAFMEAVRTLGVGGIVLLFIFIVLSLTTSVLEIYSAISLGHLFNKRRLLLSFVMYLGLQTVTQFTGLIIAALSMKSIFTIYTSEITVGLGVQFRQMFIIVTIILAIFTAGYFTLTNYLLKKKLNLE